jgi:hypothetical protein
LVWVLFREAHHCLYDQKVILTKQYVFRYGDRVDTFLRKELLILEVEIVLMRHILICMLCFTLYFEVDGNGEQKKGLVRKIRAFSEHHFAIKGLK